MKVFLSWSGEKSHAAAKAFHDWLPEVLQQVSPWLSSVSIEKGEMWLTGIRDALTNGEGVGLFFLTPSALQSPWLLYEAGGIASGVGQNRVCTVCVGLEPRDLVPPLSFYQTTKLTQPDVLSLVRTLNAAQSTPLDVARLDRSFERSWPELEERIRTVAAVEEQPTAVVPNAVVTESDFQRRVLDALSRVEARIGALENTREATTQIRNIPKARRTIASLADEYATKADRVNFLKSVENFNGLDAVEEMRKLNRLHPQYDDKKS